MIELLLANLAVKTFVNMSLCTCLQGGILRMGMTMIFVSVELTRGRVLSSSFLTATSMQQPHGTFALPKPLSSQVITPS